MSDSPIGQMTWRPEGKPDKSLHLRLSSGETWRYYKECPEYCCPDPPDFSEGFATFMHLLKMGWEIV